MAAINSSHLVARNPLREITRPSLDVRGQTTAIRCCRLNVFQAYSAWLGCNIPFTRQWGGFVRLVGCNFVSSSSHLCSLSNVLKVPRVNGLGAPTCLVGMCVADELDHYMVARSEGPGVKSQQFGIRGVMRAPSRTNVAGIVSLLPSGCRWALSPPLSVMAVLRSACWCTVPSWCSGCLGMLAVL
jgi:hypothetical protein